MYTSSFHHAAILNGQGVYKSAEQLAGSRHRARPCLYYSPILDKQNPFPHIFSLHPLLPGSCLASSSKELHHSSSCTRRPRMLTPYPITWFRILLVRICESPIVLL